MADDSERTPTPPEDRDPDVEDLFGTVQELHNRLAEIRPNLLITVGIGRRIDARVEFGGRGFGFNDSFDDVFTDAFHDAFHDFSDAPFSDAPTFRDYFNNGPQFDNVFSKHGDGWIDVHGIDVADLGVVVIPE